LLCLYWIAVETGICFCCFLYLVVSSLCGYVMAISAAFGEVGLSRVPIARLLRFRFLMAAGLGLRTIAFPFQFSCDPEPLRASLHPYRTSRCPFFSPHVSSSSLKVVLLQVEGKSGASSPGSSKEVNPHFETRGFKLPSSLEYLLVSPCVVALSLAASLFLAINSLVPFLGKSLGFQNSALFLHVGGSEEGSREVAGSPSFLPMTAL